MMARVITQETYNEVVQENIDEFSMSPKEAIDDAVKQFEAQGIDLSNIVKDLAISGEPDLIKTCLEKLADHVASEKPDHVPDILEKLKLEFGKDMARRLLGAKHGAYNVLLNIIRVFQKNVAVLKPALKTITSLMTGYPDLLDDAGISLQMELLDDQHDVETLQALLRWMRECCIQHEMNRQKIFAANVFPKLKVLLERKEASGGELRDVCAVIRALVLDDDVRHEYGKAHEHATTIAREALDVITSLLQKFRGQKTVVGDLMLTLASLLVRNEFCQMVDDAGGLKFILDVMVDYPETEKLNWQALKLLKALAGNDDVKAHIVTSGGVPLIVSVIDRMKSSEAVASSGLACISALALRSPSNSGVLFDCGAPLVIVDAMKAHPTSINVIRQGSWAARNMSVRNQLESAEFVGHGIEDLLINALKTHGKILEADVNAALRDLQLKVELKERWIGKGGMVTNDN